MSDKHLAPKAQNECFEAGLKLLQSGAYWEAHEAWEDLWRSLPSNSSAGLATKALIQFAAICYKPEQAAAGRDEAGIQRGMQTLLQTARRHLDDSSALPAPEPRWNRDQLRQALQDLQSVLDRWCKRQLLAEVRAEVGDIATHFDPRAQRSSPSK